jgi:hypothetical protein
MAEVPEQSDSTLLVGVWFALDSSAGSLGMMQLRFHHDGTFQFADGRAGEYDIGTYEVACGELVLRTKPNGVVKRWPVVSLRPGRVTLELSGRVIHFDRDRTVP